MFTYVSNVCKLFVCVWACVCHTVHVEVRGQPWLSIFLVTGSLVRCCVCQPIWSVTFCSCSYILLL